MKLSVKQSGGIAGGFVKHVDLETEALSPEDVQTFRQKVEAAGVRAMTDEPRSGPSRPGDLPVEVTIEDEGAVHTIRLTDAALPDSVRDLIAWTERHPASTTRIAPPGGKAQR